MLPIFDLQFLIQDGVIIRLGFYKKLILPERTVIAQSALSSRVKEVTLFSKGMRTLSALDKNTSVDETNQVLGRFHNSLRVSVYGHPMRQDVLEGILLRDKELKEGGPPSYFTRPQIEEQKAAG